jgi:citrate/tricarballylate utilization protein
MLGTDELVEAERTMRICNACRYCEGLCAVFPAMEKRRSFADYDLRYLANLCHGCGACYYDCQYGPPHEFAVNVPASFARLRPQSYQAYAWPRALAPLFERNGLAIAWTAALSVAVFLIAFMSLADPGVMFGTVTGPGAFYAIMPHNAMVGLFGSVFVYSLVALAMGLRAFWRDAPPGDAPEADSASIRQAMKDAGSLRYLDGGGAGCMNEDEQPETRRRLYHHLTFYGFALCFAATCVATVYHYLFGWQAPYGPLSMPVILGTLGGFGIVIGPAGLYAARRRQDRELRDPAAAARGMDVAFLAMLCLTGLTGLLLLVLRATPAMGTLLAVHLGFVFAFFLAMPYGKFVHGLYRYAALVRYAMERRGNT